MDLTPTIVPKSDQINADDLFSGPVTVTIKQVTKGNTEQPVNVELEEFPGRPFKPGKSMRRVLVDVWGKDSSVYAGRRLTLYRDPDITFGKEKVGGVRISHMSHLDKPRQISLTVTRGRKSAHQVTPLVEEQQTPTISEWTWNEIQQAAQNQGDIPNTPQWVSQQLGRKLTGWSDITEAEGEKLLNLLTTGEEPGS